MFETAHVEPDKQVLDSSAQQNNNLTQETVTTTSVYDSSATGLDTNTQWKFPIRLNLFYKEPIL